MKKVLLVILLLGIILAGCQQDKGASCPPPMISVGGECCPDVNNNTICDSLEHGGDEAEDEAEEPAEPSVSLPDESSNEILPFTVNLTILEEGINKTYYPLKRYHFDDANRENVTGIESTFDVRESAMLNILRVKKEYNYLNSRANFSDFVKRRYDLKVKNDDIEANSWIDYQQLKEEEWADANYSYEHRLEGIGIAGDEGFIETHILMFQRAGQLLDATLEYKITLFCTPELVVEVYPSEHWEAYYTTGSPVETNRKEVTRLMAEEKGSMVKNAEKVLKVCKGSPEEFTLKPREVIFYGVDGFYPHDVRVAAGQNLTIYNENLKLTSIRVYFTFVRETPRKVFNSKFVEHGKAINIEMEEPGNYTYFAFGYNPRATVIVEP